MTATTLLGRNIKVTINAEGVFINEAKVIVKDIVTDNGVLHVLDAVILPPRITVVDVVVNSADHTILEAAVVAAQLAEALSGDGPFTVFAPTDAAFAALPPGTVESLLEDPTGALADILKYHVVAGKVMSTDLSDGMTATTLLGRNIKVTINAEGVFIDNSKVIVKDIVTDNGVVHVIDAVITPKVSFGIAQHPTFGNIITDSKGKTLYFFARDAKDVSNCTGNCLNNWPVFYDPYIVVPEGLDAEDFGTLDRGNGVMQTTYKGWPLYYYVQDINSGDVTGDGRSGAWFVAKPDYTIMLATNQLVGFDGKNYKGDYTEGNETIQYFTDAYGLTLYAYSKDLKNKNTYTSADFKNDFVWPIYEMTEVILPSILDKTKFSVTDVHGRKQLSYNGWPLYYFGADNQVKGSTKGVSLPTPGTWPVARQNMPEATPVTVVDIVVASESHNTLETAVLAAGLAGALSGEGPFTVFAPTDAAFAALPAGTLDALLADPSGLLTQILLYHVVGASVLSTDLQDGMVATTLLGEDIKVSFRADGIYINEAKVVMADLEAGNGIVHVIDLVITPPASVQIAETMTKGNILTDSRGKTLYFYTRDAKDISNCTGGCLNNWPIFYDPNLRPGDGLEASDFGTIDRGNGVMQNTYKGWPLYYYVQDTKAGDIAGDGRSGVWFVAKPDYTIMLVNNQLIGNDGKNYKGDYTEGVEVIQYFTDAKGRTLYTWSRDFFNTNKFTRPDFSNNTNWPVYEEDEIVIPSLLDASLFSVIDVHGRKQMTYKGWPLYYFGADGNVRGNTKGVSVPMPGVWPVARQNMNPAIPATVVDIVVGSNDHKTLTTAVVAAELAGALSGTGPFTVFAPTDAAFAALTPGTVEALLQDPTGALADILKYHVVAGTVLSTDLLNGMTATTLLGKDIKVTINENGIFINNAKVTFANIKAGNGLVHVIDAVILPPTTVYDVIKTSADHTILETAIDAAGLGGALNLSGPYTVFAPTDAAFAALPAGTVETLLQDPTGALADILKYHVVAGKVMSTDLSNGMTATTLLGKDIKVTINADGVFINEAKVIVKDIVTDNGVVHVLDAVILPPRVTVVDVVVNSADHTILEAAVVAAQLAEALSGDGPFTVFAPTDAAFAALPAGTVETLLQDPTGALADILKYHVVAGKVMSTDLSNGMTATTLLGKDIKVTINADGVFINEAKVIVKDIVTDNGVVHVLDAVILPPRITVVDVVVNSANHTILEAAVVAAQLAEALSGDGPFTVFAPTDAAFAALPAGTVETLLQDPTGALADILKYHVVAGKVMSTDLSNGMTATTLLGKDIKVTINADGVFINEAKVIVKDIVTDNGVVHVLDAVILPPRITVVDVVVNSANHTILEAAVVAAQLAEALSGDGPFTVFAPTDAAFAALPAGTVETLLQDPTGALADILKYHVVAGKVMSADLSNGMTATTLLGKDIKVTINADGVFINEAKVIVKDIVTDNGVVHVLDAVILPPRITVVDVVVNSANHTILEAAVVAAQLAEALSGDGPFTVFAPTDAAFAALPPGTVETLLQDPTGALADILKYHVVAGKVMSTDLSNGMTATTLLGKDIKVTINADGVFINDAKVIAKDIVTDNGVVHVIDAVLIPARTTVVDVVVNSADHTILEAAVVAAGLAEALSGDGPFTVFAPTDAAFAALPAGTVETLLQDPTGALADILKYHVVAGKVMSNQLTSGQVVTSLNGKKFTVTINADGVFINKSKVIVKDIETDNGVVHVIDAVMIPDTPTNIRDLSGDTSGNFTVYPNPATANVTIDLGNVDMFSPASVSIIRADGSLVTEMQVTESQVQYNVSQLTRGMYIVVLKQNDRISTEKLIVR
jgi:uncharacterized surface protein with fasciclin (FAS1) repeats